VKFLFLDCLFISTTSPVSPPLYLGFWCGGFNSIRSGPSGKRNGEMKI